jgi:hypothetical protein
MLQSVTKQHPFTLLFTFQTSVIYKILSLFLSKLNVAPMFVLEFPCNQGIKLILLEANQIYYPLLG